jgi:hypothetical protein
VQVPEIEIIEIAENVCNLKKQEADWMLRIDIVEKGDKLEVIWRSMLALLLIEVRVAGFNACSCLTLSKSSKFG